MFQDDTIAGSWSSLTERLDRTGTLARWAHTEPALAGLTGIADLPALIGPDADRDREDDVIGALVRWAGAEGGDDPDALLVLLHLLSSLVFCMSRQFADLAPNMVTVVANELVCQIRGYLRRGRSRSYVENLRRETRRAVLREYRPWVVARRPGAAEVLLAPNSGMWEHTPLGAPLPGPDAEADVDVTALLDWAVGAGVDPVDLSLLIATERVRAAHPGVCQDGRIAAEYGVAVSTLYRRNKRTRAALQASARGYLAAVAVAAA